MILWAAYLACSWTWCIGMFLPVLLIRDYGVMGWVVFAIPNVIGAAAMGWVLRDGMSERIVREHATAIEWFRLVTVVFQLWFLMTYIAAPGGGFGTALVDGPDIRLTVIIAAIIGILLGMRHRVGILAWIISIGCAAFALSRGELDVPEDPLFDPARALWLAPVCTFGFALCPYLDPTFHRARQSLDVNRARAAFTIGFGVLFLGMITFTLLYASWGIATMSGRGLDRRAIAIVVLGHIAMQLLYTTTVHARCQIGADRWSAARIGFVMLVAGGIAYAASFFPHDLNGVGYPRDEVIYRLFMAFYGLVFPAYVWLCIIPLPRNPAEADSSTKASHVDRRAFRVFCLCVGLAAPFYWMGFLQEAEGWLAPGLGIVLLARLFIRPRPASVATPAT